MIKYDYVERFGFPIRLFYLLGAIGWFLSFYGFLRLLSDPLFWMLFAIPVSICCLYQLINWFLVALFYKPFKLKIHNELVTRFFDRPDSALPSVDIFLPCVGESIDIIRNTYLGVKNLEYKGVLKVYVLDDAGRDDVKKMAREFSFDYISRPNKGEMKKAGNLLYGYQHTDGDFIAIFDADMRPAKDFLVDVLPYTLEDDVGIVQTPQYFPMGKDVYKRSQIEWEAGYIQQDFYKLVQPARDRSSAAICVGTNALYSRKALVDASGFAQVDRSEDVFTGLKLNLFGYRVKYIPLILACGYNPPSIESFFRQHNRWCSGSFKLATSKWLWSKKINPVKRRYYLFGCATYLLGAVLPLLGLHVIIIMIFKLDQLRIENFVYFMPSLVISILFPFTKTYKPLWKGTVLGIIGVVQRYTYLYTYWLMIRGKSVGWTATAEAGHNKSEAFTGFILLIGGFTVIHLLALTFFIGTTLLREDYLFLTFPITLALLYSTMVHIKTFVLAAKEYFLDESEPNYTLVSIEQLDKATNLVPDMLVLEEQVPELLPVMATESKTPV